MLPCYFADYINRDLFTEPYDIFLHGNASKLVQDEVLFFCKLSKFKFLEQQDFQDFFKRLFQLKRILNITLTKTSSLIEGATKQRFGHSGDIWPLQSTTTAKNVRECCFDAE
jgi:hypothetical protein